MSVQSKKNTIKLLLSIFIVGIIFFAVADSVQAAEEARKPFVPGSGIAFVDPGGDGADLLANYMIALNRFMFRLAIALAVLMIMIGGFQWMMAIGNASKISNAKETIQQAIIGLIIALTAVLLFEQIDDSFTQYSSLAIGTDPNPPLECNKITDPDECKFPQCSWRCNDGTLKSLNIVIEDGERKPSCKDHNTGGSTEFCEYANKAACRTPHRPYCCIPNTIERCSSYESLYPKYPEGSVELWCNEDYCNASLPPSGSGSVPGCKWDSVEKSCSDKNYGSPRPGH